jgi:hypothetical protein
LAEPPAPAQSLSADHRATILALLTEGLGQVAAANLAGKSAEDRRLAAADLQNLRLGLEKIRAFLTLAWEMKFISHPVMHDLNERLDILGRQAARWRDWFEKQPRNDWA